MKRQKRLWTKTYKPDKALLDWPLNLNLAPNCEVAEAFLLAEGCVDRAGKQLEYIDIRIYTREVAS